LFLSLDFLPRPAGLAVQAVNNQMIINTTIEYNRGEKFVQSETSRSRTVHALDNLIFRPRKPMTPHKLWLF